ncbi:MAG: family 1 glycosylhydrolase [Anaerolineae bacterium]|jgi:beta-glucosidase
MAKASFRFPEGFLWGTTTAAQQVEGGNVNNDWWRWEQKGYIKDGRSSRVACNWWQDAAPDLDRLADMGQNALRLSLEWSRIEPREGQWDDAALDRYRELLTGLRQRGIEPMVTLHHFSTPQWFVDQGGWENEKSALSHFTRYVERVVRAFGDLVQLWCTFNEPNNYVLMGWLRGDWPPGRSNFGLAMQVMHTLLKCHAAAYHLIHELQPLARVGLASHFVVFDPANRGSWLDRLAAGLQDTMFNQATLSALDRGRMSLWTRRPFIRGVKGTFDWIGANYYYRRRVAFDRRQTKAFFGRLVVPEGAESPIEGLGEVYAKGIVRLARHLARLGRPIYITENGIHDLTDAHRPRFLLSHILQLWRAIQFNLPIRGYYHYTLVDGFEWDAGYSLRFGLVKMSPRTGERATRRSAELYADVCRANALDDEIMALYDPELAEHTFQG